MAGDSPEKKEGDEEDKKKEERRLKKFDKSFSYGCPYKGRVGLGIIRLFIYLTWHSVSSSRQHPPSCY